MTTQQALRFSVAVMTTLLALLILWQFRVAVAYTLISLAVAAALRPLASRLVGQRPFVRAAWSFLYLVCLGVGGFLLYQVGETALDEIQRLLQATVARESWQLPSWLRGTPFQRLLLTWLPTPGEFFETIVGEQGELVLPAVLGLTQGVVGTTSAIAVTLVLSLYWTVDQVHFERLWLSLLPTELRRRTRDVWRMIEYELGAYLRSLAIHSILAGLLLGLGYSLFGALYPTLLALAGALAYLLPVVGPVLAMVLPLLIGILAGTETGAFTVLYTLAVLVSIEIGVKPRLLRQRWDNPILTLLILIALTSAFGLLGSIAAPPLAALLQILWYTLVNERITSSTTSQLSDLRERQEKLLASIRAMAEPPPATVLSGIERLSVILEKAAPVLQNDLSSTTPNKPNRP
ncbi:MAG: AI-2E family transporter [Chloroflexota bacterium]